MSSSSPSNNFQQALETRNAIVERLQGIIKSIEDRENSPTNLSGKLATLCAYALLPRL